MDNDNNAADENFLRKRISRKPTIAVGSTTVRLINKEAYLRYIQRTINIAPFKRANLGSGMASCTACGWQPPSFLTDGHKRFFLNIHHLVPVADGGNDEDENLIILCPNCHSLANYLPSIITLPRGANHRSSLIRHLQRLNTAPDDWKAQYDAWRTRQKRNAVHSLQDTDSEYNGSLEVFVLI